MTTPKLKLVINNQDPQGAKNSITSDKIYLADQKYIAPGARIVTQSAANNLPFLPSLRGGRIYQ